MGVQQLWRQRIDIAAERVEPPSHHQAIGIVVEQGRHRIPRLRFEEVIDRGFHVMLLHEDIGSGVMPLTARGRSHLLAQKGVKDVMIAQRAAAGLDDEQLVLA